jgi:hypothetical protein
MTGKRRKSTASWAPVRPQPPAVPMVKRQTRREARAERRRQRRRRFGTLGISVIVVVVLIVAGAAIWGVHKATSGTSKAPRVQSTVLMTLVGSDHSAQVSTLLAHDTKTNSGLELLVPARLIVDVCGFGSQRFGQITALPDGVALARSTLSQLLTGVVIDGSWSLTADQLANLVNAVGGVTVNVDTNVIVSSGGSQVVVVPQGSNEHLSGLRAVQYATYVGAGEDANANLPRFQTVLQAVIDALPRDPSKSAALLSHSGAAPSVGYARLASLLAGLARDDAAKSLLPTDLPTAPIDSGGSPSYRLDSNATAQLISTDLSDSWPAAARGQHTSVFVQNGVGTPGLDGAACNQLTRAGFVIAGSSNATSFNHARSQVVVFSTSVDAARKGYAVAAALHLAQSDVVATAQGQNIADVLVILGRDYRP